MEKNEVDSFLDGLDNEQKADPFKPESEDPFATKEVEGEEKKEETVEEKPLPFHKDPKVQRFIDKEISKRMADIKPSETERFVKETTQDEDEVSAVLTRIIGNDTPEKVSAIKDFKKVLSGLEEKGAKKALEQFQAQAQESVREEQQAQEELVSAFENLEEEFDVDLTSNTPVAKKTRNEFIDFIKRVAPKDQYGEVVQYPDFQETFQLFKESRKPETNSRAKELASRSMQRSGTASTATQNTGKSWRDIDKIFSQL